MVSQLVSSYSLSVGAQLQAVSVTVQSDNWCAVTSCEWNWFNLSIVVLLQAVGGTGTICQFVHGYNLLIVALLQAVSGTGTICQVVHRYNRLVGALLESVNWCTVQSVSWCTVAICQLMNCYSLSIGALLQSVSWCTVTDVNLTLLFRQLKRSPEKRQEENKMVKSR